MVTATLTGESDSEMPEMLNSEALQPALCIGQIVHRPAQLNRSARQRWHVPGMIHEARFMD